MNFLRFVFTSLLLVVICPFGILAYDSHDHHHEQSQNEVTKAQRSVNGKQCEVEPHKKDDPRPEPKPVPSPAPTSKPGPKPSPTSPPDQERLFLHAFIFIQAVLLGFYMFIKILEFLFSCLIRFCNFVKELSEEFPYLLVLLLISIFSLQLFVLVD